MENNDFIISNTPLVKGILNKYKGYGIPYEDLMQEGLLGLLEAKKRYNSGREAKFSTFAAYWIRKKIIDYLNKEKKASPGVLSLDDEQHAGIKETITEGKKEIQIDRGEPVLTKNLETSEKEVLSLFFEGNKTLNEISELTGLRRERVRQIKQKALRKMKINTKLI